MRHIKPMAFILMALMLTSCGMRSARMASHQPYVPVAKEKRQEIDAVRAESKVGRSSYVVSEMAKKHSCLGTALLISARGPIEEYKVDCEDGKVFNARCELRECAQVNR